MGNILMRRDFTRPSDGNIYAGGDIISNSTSVGVGMQFANIDGILRKLILISSNSASVHIVDAHFYYGNPGTQNDNAAWALSVADAQNIYQGKISFTALAPRGSCAYNEVIPTQPWQFDGQCWVVLVATTATTPSSAEVFTLKLFIED